MQNNSISHEEGVTPPETHTSDAEKIKQLLVDNNTIVALTKGVLADIAIFEKSNTPESVSSIMRLNVQLGVLNDRKNRNLQAINEIIQRQKDRDTN